MPKFHIGSDTIYLSADLELVAMRATAFQAWTCSAMPLTVHDRIFRVNDCAVELGELGLPDIERFYGIATMRFAIGTL